MLYLLSFAIAGKIAGSLLRTEGYSQEQMLPASYSRNADLDSLREIATQLGRHGYDLQQSQTA